MQRASRILRGLSKPSSLLGLHAVMSTAVVVISLSWSRLHAHEPEAGAASVTGESSSDAARVQDENVSRRAWLEQYVLTHAGDPQRGHQLFLDQKKLNCVTCHKIRGQGGEVGPDLSHVGGKFDRPHLIESLIEPSRQIVDGYRSSAILTIDGLTKTGIIKARSDSTLTLVDSEGSPHQISLDDVDEMYDSDVSTMSEGLVDNLSGDQLADLVAYLETLRTEGRATPGEGVIAPLTLPEGFAVEVIAKGLDACTAMEITPRGRIFLCEQTGALRLVENGALVKEPLITLPVDSTWERGLIGVTVEPDFPETPYVYLCYVAKDPYPHHRVSRFTVQGNRCHSEKILLVGDDQRTLGGTVPAGHQGGALHFDINGKLFVGIGEQTAAEAAQSLHTFQGKLLRINRDGSIPSDNPLLQETTGKYRAIWAYGLRNPFTFAFDPDSGEMLINDVGGKFEEVDRGVAGGNYGWPVVEHGPTQNPRFVSPIHWYPEASICGAAFVPDNGTWPPEYQSRYLFADFVHGAIYALDQDHPTNVKLFATGLRRPVDLRFADDGSLYVLLRNAWVVDNKFQPDTGSLLRIVPPKSRPSRVNIWFGHRQRSGHQGVP